MYILIKEGQVMVDPDASQAVNRIAAGFRGWALNIDDETGVPSVGGEVKLGNADPIATISKYELISDTGTVIGEGQVKEKVE